MVDIFEDFENIFKINDFVLALFKAKCYNSDKICRGSEKPLAFTRRCKCPPRILNI